MGLRDELHTLVEKLTDEQLRDADRAAGRVDAGNDDEPLTETESKLSRERSELSDGRNRITHEEFVARPRRSARAAGAVRESWAFDAWTAIEARDSTLAERILLAIEQYAETGRGDVRKLTARDDLRRLRVGSWRVLFRTSAGRASEILVVVVAITDRRDAYR